MIGIAEPCSLEIEMNRNAQKVPEIKEWIAKRLDLTPKGIMEYMEGKRPRFYATSKYGHYGYKGAGPEGRKWEETDLVEEMRRALRLPIGRVNG
jgi:S-adenosylmethionine synthetase